MASGRLDQGVDSGLGCRTLHSGRVQRGCRGSWEGAGVGPGHPCRRGVLHVCSTLGEDGSSFKPSLSYCGRRERGRKGDREERMNKQVKGERKDVRQTFPLLCHHHNKR